MYQHITRKERVEIAHMLRRKWSQSDIARTLGVDRSTISREVTRNTDSDGIYRAHHAHKQARERHKGKQEKHKVIEHNTKLEQYIIKSLEHYWSPEQIAGRIKREQQLPYVSHTTVYAYIQRCRSDLKKYRRHKRHRKLSKISLKQAKKQMISTRPQVVEARSRIGDWEGDTIVGKERTERILTHVDRRSGLLVANRTQADSHSVRIATREVFSDLPCTTVTYDNGSEFAAFERTTEDIGAPIYFAEPGKPHQRGTNENTNSLLRQFYPKGCSFVRITQRDLNTKVELINNRPRKRLNYRTPREVFDLEVGCCG